MTTKTNYEDKFSLMVIGDEGVGKTSIIERYVNGTFSPESRQTIGVDNYTKTKKMKKKNILIKIWDTVGQEKYAMITKSHYKIAHGIFLVCSYDNKESFNNLKKWLEGIRENCEPTKTKIIVVVNKTDIKEGRQFTLDQISIFSGKNDIEYIEISAKDNENIDEMFEKMISDVYKNSYDKYKGFELEEGASSSGVARGCC